MRAGVVAIVSILGIAWLGNTLFEGNRSLIINSMSQTVREHPWVFSIGLFVLSILLYSQAATVAALMGVGIQMGLALPLLIAMYPAVNGYFFLPTYGTVVAAISFDQTGTTRVGRGILNHSFMLPGFVATWSAVAIGMAITKASYR
jgi:anaerobic C4-dicarboxylate transporter DcuA